MGSQVNNAARRDVCSAAVGKCLLKVLTWLHAPEESFLLKEASFQTDGEFLYVFSYLCILDVFS